MNFIVHCDVITINKTRNAVFVISVTNSVDLNGPGLAILTTAPDNAGIASLRGKLNIYVIYSHCIKISLE